MKFGLISLFAMYLVIRFFFNVIVMAMYLNKKVSTNTLNILNMIELLISFIFTIMIIRLAVKSGGRA